MTGAHRPKRTGPQRTGEPAVRCAVCLHGGRCKWWPERWIRCRTCGWGDPDPRRCGLWWRLRVWVGR
jgi:hypothetical protein